MSTSAEFDKERTPYAGRRFLTSTEAVELLGISKSTLYAYVSRGLIHSEPEPDAPRQRRYRSEDVQRMLQRQRMRADPEAAAESTLSWGQPILESSISRIIDGRLYYRGRDASELARSHSFEQVIGILWAIDDGLDLPESRDRSIRNRHRIIRTVQSQFTETDPLRIVLSVLPLLEEVDPASYDTSREASMTAGADVLRAFISVLVGAEGASGIARTLQAHWAPGNPAYETLINAALTLCADHELNASTFTVRCIASAGSPVYSAIAGGLAAIRGVKHGGATLQAESLLRDVRANGDAYAVLRSRLERGENLPGFGHYLYPEGDPRAVTLISLIRQLLPDSETAGLAEGLLNASEDLQGGRANIDLGLALVCHELGLFDGAPLTMMALGRVAGWVAHAMEERERDQLIRPRARYGRNQDSA